MQTACRRGFTSFVKLSSRRTSTINSAQCFLRITPPTSTLLSRLTSTATFHTMPALRSLVEAASAPSEAYDTNGEIITRFEDLGTKNIINQTIVDTLTQTMKLDTMTTVQSQTINQAVQGRDTLALARTGEGKTVAFLLPVIQRILETHPELQKRTRQVSIDIQSLIISPTRELAEQIAKEATRMVANTGIQVGLCVGGTGRDAAVRNMQRYGCHILVGTPGRLNDVLSDRSTPIKVPNLNSFVLDEADRLLDDGFGPAIEQIYRLLPSKMELDRQTLMFSATMEQEVMGMVRKFMKKDFHTVQTIVKGEIQTHDRVPQFAVLTLGLENLVPALFELIKKEIATTENFKAIVFFNTAAEATLTKEIYASSNLAQKIGIDGMAMHARLSQNQRTKTSDNFRTSKRAIMFASDVAARGMDFPNVTHVIQMNVPKDRDTYIHRVGRTGRAGKEGQGWLLLSQWDVRTYRSKLRNLPLKEVELECAKLDMSESLSIPNGTAEILSDVVQTARNLPFDIKAAAYRATMSLAVSVDKAQLVEAINRLSQYGWGLDPPPAIQRSLVNKIGFARVQGLIIGEDSRSTKEVVSGRGGNGRGGNNQRGGGREVGGQDRGGAGPQRGGRSGFGLGRGGFVDRDSSDAAGRAPGNSGFGGRAKRDRGEDPFPDARYGSDRPQRSSRGGAGGQRGRTSDRGSNEGRPAKRNFA